MSCGSPQPSPKPYTPSQQVIVVPRWRESVLLEEERHLKTSNLHGNIVCPHSQWFFLLPSRLFSSISAPAHSFIGQCLLLPFSIGVLFWSPGSQMLLGSSHSPIQSSQSLARCWPFAASSLRLKTRLWSVVRIPSAWMTMMAMAIGMIQFWEWFFEWARKRIR